MQKIGFIENSMGINGAALATTISMIVFSGLFFFQANHYLAIAPLRRKMVRIVLVAIIPTVILVYFKSFIAINLLTVLLLAGLFFVLYLALMLVTDSFDRNDLMILKTIWKKVKQ